MATQLTWTDELKAKVIKMYEEADPTPETSTEICKDIADEIETSPNGVRMILVQAGVYVKKESGNTSPSKGSSDTGSKRISKEASVAELKAMIQARGASVDEDILSKLTGKAAVYFTQVLKKTS